ncbi:hypothetical protein QR680_011009 [Steinernema hermaphroditum]|uniref:glutaminase n=1 Tax=Steinernema hermaphroditum TaxID=289476 RepID=A0AA39ITB6_9BILA|nr:hypothetical protein QR680_011009 [Steinernema hermaphroditum]
MVTSKCNASQRDITKSIVARGPRRFCCSAATVLLARHLAAFAARRAAAARTAPTSSRLPRGALNTSAIFRTPSMPGSAKARFNLPSMDSSGQEVVDSQEHYSQHTLGVLGSILQNADSVAQIMSKTAEGLDQAIDVHHPSSADLIYDLFKVSGKDEASVAKLLSVLKSFGIHKNDPRLKEVMERIQHFEALLDDEHCDRRLHLNRSQFRECVTPSVTLISTTLRNQLIIPNWAEFTSKIKAIFEECKNDNRGNVADYIPQLARADVTKWGMAICTIDGQRYSLGDATTPFCVQSISKAFNYAIAASDLGTELVHGYVGHEPSGLRFNEICLNSNGKPHNPLVNAGAIIVTSLMKNNESMADRFDYVMSRYRKIAGGGYIGFNNATFLGERETADRNYALAHYMKEKKCFPPETQSLREELDFYFQLCSIEAHCESAAVMAATLANGGVCPLTEKKEIAPLPCRDVLSLMYSCGMYDYSGEFAFKIGLPAKSGVSGAMIVVVPNLMGICLWSPRLENVGNSCRGVRFCEKLIETFKFHNYDSLLHAESNKIDPRRKVGNKDTDMVVSLLYAVKNGDFNTVRRLFLTGMDMNLSDYDGRTAIHLAACENQLLILKFLLTKCNVNSLSRDRWGHTALDDARFYKHKECVRALRKAMEAETELPGEETPMTNHSSDDEEERTGAMMVNGGHEEDEPMTIGSVERGDFYNPELITQHIDDLYKDWENEEEDGAE